MTTTDLTTAIFNRFKKIWPVILVAGITLGILLALYAKSKPLFYTSTATIFSLTSGNDNPSASSALSVILGTEANKSFSDETSINIIELSQSRAIREAVAAMVIKSMGNKIIAELLVNDKNNHRGLLEAKADAPKDKEQIITWGGQVLQLGINAVINKNNSFVLTYTGRSEELVKVISYGFIDKISQFYIDLKREKAKRDFEFATGKVDSLARVMGSKDYRLIAMDKTTLFTNTNRLEYSVPQENLLADKQMVRNQYAQAIANQQSAAYKLQKDTPVIKVLDKPDPPYEVKGKSAIVYGIIGFLGGMLLISGFAVAGLVLKYVKHEARKVIFGDASKSDNSTTTTASAL